MGKIGVESIWWHVGVHSALLSAVWVPKMRVQLLAQSDWNLWSLNVSANPQAHFQNTIDTLNFLVSVRKIIFRVI